MAECPGVLGVCAGSQTPLPSPTAYGGSCVSAEGLTKAVATLADSVLSNFLNVKCRVEEASEGQRKPDERASLPMDTRLLLVKG